MQISEKTDTNGSLDYSFLVNKLEQLSRENSLYRKAFVQIEDVANKVAGGDLSARIKHMDDFDKISPALFAVNKAYEITDSFIRTSEVTQQTALREQDEFRKEQLRELANYFKEEIAPVLT
ncbi:MAG: hypothetical protein COB54_09300 [Alphaproteobacteria bacterium]|nr:MAG: hypothetical protein COB54_09300 [Alphaproteobacteria bacterium]